MNKTITPLALVGNEMIIANSALRALLAIISYPTCARGIIVKYFHGYIEKLPVFILGFQSRDETAMLVCKTMAKCRSSFA